MDFTQKPNYKFEDLIHIMELLRSPNGCPWDKEQTHHSIRQNFIEETYEVIEAIDDENTELLKEELGDVLLQVVFHSQLEAEQNNFNIDDVCDEICKKLIVRHPHVFSDVSADTSDIVLKNWDNIKMQTKSQKSQTEAMQSVSKSLPALMRSVKLQQKAAKVGFDWEDVSGAIAKVHEELDELEQAIENNDKLNQAEELGDLLFSVVNVSRFVKVDAEKALYDACNKFTDRFCKLEQLAKCRNIDIKTASLSELDSLWDEVK